MIVGVPKEVKNHEYRVGLTPDLVSELSVGVMTSWLRRKLVRRLVLWMSIM